MVLDSSEPSRIPSWRERITQGGRILRVVGVLWFLAAPISIVAHRPVVIALSLLQLAGTWLFATPSADRHSARWAWALRGLALTQVPVVIVSSLGYRVLAIATLATRLAYMSRIPAPFALSQRRRMLNWLALGAGLSAALTGADFVARAWLRASDADSAFATVAALMSVPLAIADWVVLGELLHAQPGPAAPTQEKTENSEKIVAWKERLRAASWLTSRVLFPLGLGASVTCAGLAAGFGYALNKTDFNPGVFKVCLSSATLATAAVCLVAYGLITRWDQAGLRRAMAGCALFQAPLIWACLFRPQFDAQRWNQSARPIYGDSASYDGEMAEDIVHSGMLRGKTRAEVQALLGRPTINEGDSFLYMLQNNQPCRGIFANFDSAHCVQAGLWGCD